MGIFRREIHMNPSPPLHELKTSCYKRGSIGSHKVGYLLQALVLDFRLIMYLERIMLQPLRYIIKIQVLTDA